MTIKRDIRKLIRGGLTGEEAGKLVLQDNWLVDRGKEGFLSQRDMADIKSSLKTSHDIEVYNSYIKLYQLVDYTLKDATIHAREAQFYLMWLDNRLAGLLQKASHNWSLLFHIPAIVTQKQYEELSQRQRELNLKQPNDLGEVLELRAEHYPEDKHRGDWPLEWESAIHEIQELIKAGKLTPLKLKDREDYYDFMKREIDYQPAEDTVEKLDKLLEEGLTMPEEELDDFLDMTVFIGEELYQAGLPEWIEHIETYRPNLYEETAARPPGMMQAQRVAIIQQPKPDEVDERGYWIEKDIFSSQEKPDIEKERESIDAFLKAVKNRIKSFLSIQAVMDAISQIVGVDFSEDMRQHYEGIEAVVDIFNSDMDGLFLSAHGWMEELGLGLDGGRKPYQIKIGRLKPTAKSLRYYQERMAIALGANWVSEAIDNLEYEPQEEDSLAHEVSQELTEVQGMTADEMAEELKRMREEERHD
jgi:hypothetical protein